MIYLDNAATTKLNAEAKKDLIDNLDYFGNPSSSYSFAKKSKKLITESKNIISEIIKCEKEEIYFTSGGSESNTWALFGLLEKSAKKTILISEIEHASILNSVSKLEKLGFTVKKLKVNNKGEVSEKELENNITKDTLLVSIIMINNEIGTLQNIKKLCNIAHKYGALFHTDAVQTIGHVKLDVKELDIDMASASAHKFGGPKGIGFLYIKKGTNMSNIIIGGHQQKGLRPGTENVAAIHSMAIALLESSKLIDSFKLKTEKLKKVLKDRLNQNKIIYSLNGNEVYSGIISLTIPFIENEALVNYLDLHNICVSYGSACNTGILEPSNVLKSIGLNNEYANSTIRISFSNESTEDEVLILVDKIIKFIEIAG